MLGLSQSLVSSIAGALMVEQRPNTAEPDNLPTALWDVSQHARESGGTRYHYLASDTAGSDLVVSQLARRVLPTLYREYSGHPGDQSADEAPAGPMNPRRVRALDMCLSHVLAGSVATPAGRVVDNLRMGTDRPLQPQLHSLSVPQMEH